MKKRILAVIGVILMLVPIFALSVSASETTEEADTETVIAEGQLFFDIVETYATHMDSVATSYIGDVISHASCIQAMQDRAAEVGDDLIYQNIKSIVFPLENLYCLQEDSGISGTSHQITFKGDYWSGLDEYTEASFLVGRGWWASMGMEVQGDGEPYTTYYGRGEMQFSKPAYVDGEMMTITLVYNNTSTGFGEANVKKVSYCYKSVAVGGTEEGALASAYYETWELAYRKIEYSSGSPTNEQFGDSVYSYAFAFDTNKNINLPTYIFDAVFGISGKEYAGYSYRLYRDQTLLSYQSAFTEGYTKGETEGYSAGYYEGSYDGYDNGRYDGYNIGYSAGEKDGYSEGHTDGYKVGYGEGQRSVSDTPASVTDMVVGIFEAPVKLIDGMLGFEIFGINVAAFLKVILTLAITAAIVWFILKLSKG